MDNFKVVNKGNFSRRKKMIQNQNSKNRIQQETLAWHETLELHELVAFQSIGLMKLKMGIGEIQNETLKGIYNQAISNLGSNITELLQFYEKAPRNENENPSSDLRTDDAFYAGDLLLLSKTAVRNYAIAITETATTPLKTVLIKQLNTAIELHDKIYTYMYQKGLYPSYDFDKLLSNDVKLAQKALNMKY